LDNPAWLRGLAETRASVLRLNGTVVSKLVAAGIPAVGVSSFPWCKTTNRALIQSNENVLFLQRVEELLQQGLIPVLHGDAVLDHKLGCTILSGDTLLLEVCKAIDVDYAVFLTDVDGVFDRPPGTDPDANLILDIAVRENGDFDVPQTDIAEHDSTGGIATKIKSAVEVVASGVRVSIVRAGTEHAAVALHGGTPTIGTSIFRAKL
jgi:isopentenyl phosphate kinase